MKNGRLQYGAVFFFNLSGDSQMNKTMIKGAVFTLAVFAVAAFVQRNVMAVPVIGDYLPK